MSGVNSFKFIFLHQVVELAEVKYLVLYAERIDESALWHTALNGHLAAFMAYFRFATGTGLLALCTFCRCTAMAATLTTTYTFYFLLEPSAGFRLCSCIVYNF